MNNEYNNNQQGTSNSNPQQSELNYNNQQGASNSNPQQSEINYNIQQGASSSNPGQNELNYINQLGASSSNPQQSEINYNIQHGEDHKTSSEHFNSFSNLEQADMTKGKKLKKKHGVINLFKLTAGAVAFGLVAGAAFQGYYMITKPSTSEEKSTGLVAEIADTTKDEGAVIPTSLSSGGVITDVSDVVANTMPAIVAINATANVTTYDFFGREFSQEQQGSGSGIIIGQNDSELLIVTNNHVVEGADTVEIVFVDESTVTAVTKGSDANSDLAVVSVDMNDISEDTAKAIKVATLGNSDEVQPGEMAIAIGNALGYGQSVTVGYISAVNREVALEDKTMTLLQTDAAINPGNSGGALLNAAGQVIGINTVKLTQTASIAVEGMGYAIPITSAVPMINELMNREYIAESEQGYLGIDAATAQNVTDVTAQRFNMPIGVYVNNVIEDSPAEKAGLSQGSIITALDGVAVETVDDLKNALGYKKAGQKIKLTVQVKENGEYTEKNLEVTLGNRN